MEDDRFSRLVPFVWSLIFFSGGIGVIVWWPLDGYDVICYAVAGLCFLFGFLSFRCVFSSERQLRSMLHDAMERASVGKYSVSGRQANAQPFQKEIDEFDKFLGTLRQEGAPAFGYLAILTAGVAHECAKNNVLLLFPDEVMKTSPNIVLEIEYTINKMKKMAKRIFLD